MPKKDFNFAKAEDSTGFLLWQVTNLWQREIKKALEPYELTHAQFVLLASIHWLSIDAQCVTQILLSKHTKIDPMTTSTVLRTLQTKGLVQRKEHSTDTRAKTITLTEAGIKMIQEAVKTVEQFDSDFFSKITNPISGFNKNLIALLDNKE
jgi:MarR family transcriptional regulator, organic hydroperoxide resistance regulator